MSARNEMYERLRAAAAEQGTPPPWPGDDEEKEQEMADKKIRWTITGEGAPLESREATWATLNKVVEHANAEGLRVSVVEVEEES